MFCHAGIVLVLRRQPVLEWGAYGGINLRSRPTGRLPTLDIHHERASQSGDGNFFFENPTDVHLFEAQLGKQPNSGFVLFEQLNFSQ